MKSPHASTPSIASPAKDVVNELAKAIAAKGAVHSHGLIGGLGLKVVNPQLILGLGKEANGRNRLAELVLKRAEQALEEAGIVYGVLDEEVRAAVEELVDKGLQGDTSMVVRKVAQGEAPEPGEDGSIEYPLNYHGRPFHHLANLSSDSPRKNCTVVHVEEVLAVLHSATAPKKGMSVQGESRSPESGLTPTTPSFDRIAGENTAIVGNQLVAACDGLCEEDSEGRLRIVPQIVVPRVNEATGRLPETGVTQANVIVEEAVRGQGVATAENLFVGVGNEAGAIEGNAFIQARNLLCNGRIVGDSSERVQPIEVAEICVVGEIVNRTVMAGLILVARDSQFARLDGADGIWVDGSLRGGVVKCRTLLQVKADLGTKGGGSHTQIVLPAEPVAEHRKKKIIATAGRYREQLQELVPQLEELERHAEKRAKADPYWAKLLEGEAVQPHNPLQTRALRQFVEYTEQKRNLGRQIKGIKKTLAQLAAESKKTEDKAKFQEARVVVGGMLYLDVAFETIRPIGGGDEALAVSFEHDGNQFVRSTLGKARSLLLKQVNAYREQQSSHVEEKRAAIEKMFAGQDKKPAAPEMPDHEFILAVQWLDGESSEELDIHAVLSVRALEPQKVWVKNTARLKRPCQGACVGISAVGAKGVFTLEADAPSVAGWKEDENIKNQLSGLVIGEVSALQAMGVPQSADQR